MNKKLLTATKILCIAVFLFSAVMLVKYFSESNEADNIQDTISGNVNTPPPSWSRPTPPPKTTIAPEVSNTPEATELLTPTVSPAEAPDITTPTVIPTENPTPEITPIATPTENPTPEITPIATPTENPTPSITPIATPTQNPTPGITPSVTPAGTPDVSTTPTPTPTPKPTPTPTPKPTPTPNSTPTPTLTPTPAPSVPEWTTWDQYGDVYKQNNDTVGWITIEKTRINHAVMQTVNNPNYYIDHNFNKEYTNWGQPYVDARCDIVNSDNIIINGHHMYDGSMFSNLVYYVWNGQAYWKNHRYIYFDTFDGGFGTYEIFSVMKISINDSFKFTGFVNAPNENEYNTFVNTCISRSRYNTGIKPKYGEQLLTLVTCEGSREDLRVVIVARRVA